KGRQARGAEGARGRTGSAGGHGTRAARRLRDMTRLRCSHGGEVEIAALEGDRIRVWSGVAAAPGSRLDATLPSRALMRLKVQRCRRNDTGFTIEGRLIDMTREARTEISGMLSRSSA